MISLTPWKKPLYLGLAEVWSWINFTLKDKETEEMQMFCLSKEVQLIRRQNTETFYLECSILVDNTGNFSLELASFCQQL